MLSFVYIGEFVEWWWNGFLYVGTPVYEVTTDFITISIPYFLINSVPSFFLGYPLGGYPYVPMSVISYTCAVYPFGPHAPIIPLVWIMDYPCIGSYIPDNLYTVTFWVDYTYWFVTESINDIIDYLYYLDNAMLDRIHNPRWFS